jgi:nucleoside-diphosphate-sugar epimerase
MEPSSGSHRVLVTGATGAVGPRVVQTLLQAGYTVRTLALNAPSPDILPGGVDMRLGDVTDPMVVQQVVQDVDAVVHLAALLHIVNPSLALYEKYKRINIEGTATVVKAAVQAGVKRIVFSSTIAVYGPSKGQILTEESPTEPDTLYAQTKLEAERIVLNAKRSGMPIGVVLRFGAIYGSRIKGNYESLVRSLAHGTFVPIGDGRNRRTLLYDKDAARAILLTINHPNAVGRIFNVSDGSFHTVREIIEVISRSLGRRPPSWVLPVKPIRFIVGIVEDMASVAGLSSPVTRAMIDKYTEDIAVESKRIQEELSFAPIFDLETGWRETIEEMRMNGDL